MAVTDRRILFVSGDVAAGEVGTDAGSLAYEDLAAVGVEGTGESSLLALSMANGVRWEFPLPDADPAVVDSVASHLRWVGKLRARLVACRNGVELAAGEIRSHASDMNWMDAEDVYDDVRAQLDQLITAVQLTEPIDDDVIAPELTDLERTLERAYARLFIERADSQLELGQQLVENGDYEQAQPVLRAAHGQYERAEGRADAVKRADEFQFGEHRELLDDLDRLEWNIETVAAEPIRQAHEAKIMATNTDDPETALDHWETAYQRYGNVLTLELGTEDRYFTGNREKVRQELYNAADQLIDRHRRFARSQWHEARDTQDAGNTKEALRAGAVARDHIERAGELASEFQPDFARELELRRQEIEDELHGLRQRGNVNEATAEADSDTEPSEANLPVPEGSRGAEALANMDTHHEIRLNAAVDGQTADGGRHHEPFADEEGNKDADTADDEQLIGPTEADGDDSNAETNDRRVAPDDAGGE